ncbi:hypothetical protein [Clostridium beijerinckii]|uniref:hypothetical protein n=1 Tax=Clostridium beijerinckii TaxID=1520 RepID=UPI00047C4F51|nr:hypothetical protein [Clostridium beijerinckii]
MANQDVLSARLEVKDSFTGQLDRFVKSVLGAETAFNQLVSKLESSSLKLEQSLDRISKKSEEASLRIAGQNDRMANSIIKNTERVELTQNKSIENLTKRYSQMGTNVQSVFKTINKDAEALAKSGMKINIGGSSSSNKKDSKTNSGTELTSKGENFFTGLFTGNFSKMIGALSVIGIGITGAQKGISALEGYAEQGFNAVNSLTGNLLSLDGIKEGLMEASQFQTNRIALDTLYDNDPVKGQQYYQMGTKIAKETPYSESEIGELQKKLAGSHVNYNSKQLMTLLDVASVKPELGASHVGFSVVDAMAGRSTSLKTNYMLDNKEINKYLQSLKKTDPKDYAKWKDAFNKKGTVENKQEYFDLLTDYVQKETSFNGLTEKYSHTISGMMDRLQGNWETLKADLLGIDANNTGMMKSGQVTVVSSFNDFMTDLNHWLDDDKTKGMLADLGSGLGQGVKAVTDALSDLMKKVDWKEVGKTLKQMGDSIADFIKKLTSSPEFTNFINNLPKLLDKVLKDQGIKLKTEAKTGVDIANGNVGAYVKDYATGQGDRAANILGLPTSDEWSSVSNPYANNNNNLTAGDYTTQLSGSNIVTDYNASTYLAKNSNLSDEQREEIHDYMSKDKVGVYNNITIEHISADNFNEIMESLKQAQGNSK